MAMEPTEPTQPIEIDDSHQQDANQEASPGALRQLWQNLLSTPWQFRESVVRHGRPTSDR
ncbi:MAG: hypothetical protein IH898_04640, partial [Planctomycetes bacterium]|nr:hypothetical protein [Planctomycetota bacterium]